MPVTDLRRTPEGGWRVRSGEREWLADAVVLAVKTLRVHAEPDLVFKQPAVDACLYAIDDYDDLLADRQDVGSTGTHGVHPVSSPFGAAYGAGYGASASGFQSSARLYAAMNQQNAGQSRERPFDPHYSQWRERQMEQLDRDYDEYCQETQAKFERDFGAWRERRGEQRPQRGWLDGLVEDRNVFLARGGPDVRCARCRTPPQRCRSRLRSRRRRARCRNAWPRTSRSPSPTGS